MALDDSIHFARKLQPADGLSTWPADRVSCQRMRDAPMLKSASPRVTIGVQKCLKNRRKKAIGNYLRSLRRRE